MTETYSLIFVATALVCWVTVLLRATRHPLGIASPIALLSTGVLTFYIVPSLYWLLRPWPYNLPTHVEGLSTLQLGAIIQSLPFLVFAEPRSASSNKAATLTLVGPASKKRLWSLAGLAMTGLAWRVYLISLGDQGRLQADTITLFGSEDLGFLANAITNYYPVFYICLFAFGTKNQKRVALATWLIDGGLVIMSLHRYAFFLFVLYSFVGLRL